MRAGDKEACGERERQRKERETSVERDKTTAADVESKTCGQLQFITS